MQLLEHNWKLYWLGIGTIVLLQACKAQPDQFAMLLRDQLNQSGNTLSVPTIRLAKLKTFYKTRGYRPVWVDKTGPLPHANELLGALRAAGNEA